MLPFLFPTRPAAATGGPIGTRCISVFFLVCVLLLLINRFRVNGEIAVGSSRAPSPLLSACFCELGKPSRRSAANCPNITCYRSGTENPQIASWKILKGAKMLFKCKRLTFWPPLFFFFDGGAICLPAGKKKCTYCANTGSSFASDCRKVTSSKFGY